MTIINDVVDKVTVALYNEFGRDYTYYPEHISQGFKTPCFMVTVLETFQTDYVGKRAKRTIPICINYVPVKDGYTKEMNDISDRLFDCLEFIGEDGDMIRGLNARISFDATGNLIFFIDYPILIYKKRPDIEESMNQIGNANIKTRGEN